MLLRKRGLWSVLVLKNLVQESQFSCRYFSLVPFSLQTKAEGQSKLWSAFWSWSFCQDIHVDDCFNDTGLNRDWSEVVSYLKSSCTRLLNIAMHHGTGEWPNVYQVGWPRLITVMGIGAFLEVETFSGPEHGQQGCPHHFEDLRAPVVSSYWMTDHWVSV